MILTISIITIVVFLVLYFVKRSWIVSIGAWIFSKPWVAILLMLFAIIGISFVLGRVFGDLSLRCSSIKRNRK